MKVVVLNGSTGADKDGCDALSERVAALLERRGAAVHAYTLRECKLAHCVGCFACWVESPGLCKTDDHSQEIARAVIRADVAVIVTPITFGGFSSAAKRLIDRLICLISPFFTEIDGEVHHRPRYEHYPAKLDVGELVRPDPEAAEVFRALVQRNAINFHAPAAVAAVVTRDDSEAEVDRALEMAVDELTAKLEEVAA